MNEELPKILRDLKELPKCKCGGTFMPIFTHEQDTGDMYGDGGHRSKLFWRCGWCGKEVK